MEKKRERTRCECGGHPIITRIWEGTYEVCCKACGRNTAYFTSPPEDAEANGYLIWMEVLNKDIKED